MSASFTLSPPYKCNLYTISYNPTLALQRFIHILINLYQYSPISIHNKYNSHNDTHTHTHTTHTTTPPTPPHNHPHPHAHTPTHPTLTPPTHTPTYIYYPKHPNLHPISPPTHTKHFITTSSSFQLPPIYLLHSCTVTITLHQHMNTILNIRTLIKLPFGSYRTNHHNATRQPLS